MITERDKNVILSVAKHRILTQRQMQELYFPSYNTCQRRIREEYIPNKLLESPFYWQVGMTGRRTPLYRLGKNGVILCREWEGREYSIPRWSLNYIPHILGLNNVLIKLVAKDFEIEYPLGKIIVDAVINGEIAIEYDRGTICKEVTIEKLLKYNSGFADEIRLVCFVSRRRDIVHEWAQGLLLKKRVIYVHDDSSSIIKLRHHLHQHSTAKVS